LPPCSRFAAVGTSNFQRAARGARLGHLEKLLHLFSASAELPAWCRAHKEDISWDICSARALYSFLML
jgi:hypothetical protein